MKNQTEHFIKIHDEDIPALTGLRAFAALWVLILHTCFGEVNEYGFFPAFDHKLNWGILENFILMEGNLPVSLFFILSGFIMAHVYSPHFKESLQPKLILIFYIKRLARIYPVHLLITLILAGLFFSNVWQPIRPFDLESVLLSAGLLNVLKDPSANIPAWSVSAEWLAYIACPFIIYGAAKIKTKKFDVLWVLALCLLYPYIFKQFFCCTGTSGGGAILKVMIDFIIGCILYRMHCSRQFLFDRKNLNDWICLLLFSLLFIASFVMNKIEATHTILPFMLYYLANSTGFIRAFFASKIMVYLGIISYCLYMVHYPVLEVFTYFYSDFFYAMPQDYSQLKLWGFFSLMMTVMILAASGLYYAVERPCRRFIVKNIS